MTQNRLRTLWAILGVAAVCMIAFWLINTEVDRRDAIADARTQVQRWVEKLDGQTTDAGIYIRHPGDRLPETDPWGAPLAVVYTQGGLAEVVCVRSAGPDGTFHTRDDIVAQRMAMNLKGAGTGAQQNVEEFSRRGARGWTKGVVEGVKESVKEGRRGPEAR